MNAIHDLSEFDCADDAETVLISSASPPASGRRPRITLPECEHVVDEHASTDVSSVVSDLARLADPSCVLRLCRQIPDEVLTPPETLIASLVAATSTLRGICEMSPMREDDTLQFLARLVRNGYITSS